ncbi:hypothetical protein [Calothrix sp. NIES-3974]|uniref:hypothetical protein n=1 Tax=Calothrix sp. NIES-3974 TaxID=2005462 RepID=UPI000B619B21|nr:hypothetical protein [Calothrix sp. NIES-3974]BAZ05600.1 hypothetical protein NIES3974_22510 [Calothrix sp. NIES-3974]
MGRWTPLVLMAGGLAILLGTLLGINFPMGRQTAQQPQPDRTSGVLPANINVNSTVSGSNGTTPGTRVAQSNATTQTGSTAQPTTGQTQAQAGNGTTTIQPVQPAPRSDRPIRALW